jgi:tRNA1(Val) A37 N6-methylase TrmN6
MSSLKIEPDQSQKAATTLDDFLGGRIKVAQPKQGHRAGSDAVWLQAAVAAQPGDRVLDAGAGVGVAGLCLLARCPQIHVTAVDIDAGAVVLAEANAQLNAYSAQLRAITLDLTARSETLIAKGLVREGYDQVMANPPFQEEGAVRAAPDRRKATAHVMQAGDLAVWIRFLASMTAPKGRVTLIYPAEHLGALLRQLEGRFGDVKIFPLFPRATVPATRIILQGRKGSRAAPKLLPGLVLHDSDGRYTDAAEAVLREGEALRLQA